MSLTIHCDQVPLCVDDHGTVRVGGTRVTLETVVGEFNQGASAEEIALGFPTVHLADIYNVVGYYLKHHVEVDAYIASQYEEGDRLQQLFQAKFDPQGIRDRLLARMAERKANNAPVPHG